MMVSPSILFSQYYVDRPAKFEVSTGLMKHRISRRRSRGYKLVLNNFCLLPRVIVDLLEVFYRNLYGAYSKLSA